MERQGGENRKNKPRDSGESVFLPRIDAVIPIFSHSLRRAETSVTRTIQRRQELGAQETLALPLTELLHTHSVI